MNIGPYTPGIIRPTYKAPRLNEELATKVLGAKQGEFNAAYQSIQNLKQQALNIQFLHPTGKEKIDNYNSEINDYFGKLKDYGDLTNPEVQQGYVGLFSKIADDTDLLNLYRTDKQYQNQIQSIKTMKTAKDPNKAGYSAINEAVWYNGKGGLKDYLSNKNASEASQMKPAEYTPYYDYRPELSSIVKDIKFDGTKVTYRDGSGTLHTEETKGVSQEKVKANLVGRFSGMAKKQLDIEADFSYMQSKDNPDTRRQIYDADIVNGKSTYDKVTNEIEKTKAQIAIMEGKPDKQSEVEQLRSNLTKYEQISQDAFKQANTPWAEYKDLPESVIRDKFKQLHTDARYDQISNGIAYRISSSDIKNDDAFWKSKQLGLDYAKFDADTKYKQQMFGLEVAKEVRLSKEAEAKVKAENPETPPVIVPIAGESNSSLDLSQIGTKVNDWNAKARTLSDNEVASIATGQMQSSGSLLNSGTIEETFLKKYIKQNPDRFDGKSNLEKTEILKAAREEFRAGKSNTPEYQELVLGDQVRDAMNDLVNEAWTKAKDINQVAAVGEDGKFWTSTGTEIDPHMMQGEVARYIKDKNLEFVIGGIQPNVSDESVSGKDKATVIYNNRQTQLANINAAREAMKENGEVGQKLLGIKDVDWDSPFIVNPEGSITYTPTIYENGKYTKGDPVTVKTEKVRTLDNNMMMLYNLGKPIKIPHNGVDIYISPDKEHKSTTVVYKWGSNRESTTISNGSYYDIGTIKQLATDYIDKKKAAYPNLF